MPSSFSASASFSASSSSSSSPVDIDALNAFLRSSKSAAVSTAPSAPKVILVMGNEAADVDSMVCAVSYALVLSRGKKKQRKRDGEDDDDDAVVVVPMISVPREDFALRTDAAWLFAQLGVDLDALTFADDLDPLALDAAGRLSELVLVDHNVPSAPLRSLLPKITRVIDHHQDESQYPSEADVEIALLGSCATLITEAIVAAEAADAADAAVARGGSPTLMPGGPIAKMLAAAVLLDTQNLDPEATRTTPRDAAALRVLSPAAGFSGDADADAFYQTLKRERFDQMSLSPRDLLRRDYKQWDMGVGHHHQGRELLAEGERGRGDGERLALFRLPFEKKKEKKHSKKN